jgi:hypothetical protein
MDDAKQSAHIGEMNGCVNKCIHLIFKLGPNLMPIRTKLLSSDLSESKLFDLDAAFRGRKITPFMNCLDAAIQCFGKRFHTAEELSCFTNGGNVFCVHKPN